MRKNIFFIFAIVLFYGYNISATTITVTSDADAGIGSLRQAVITAAAGDTINFAPFITNIILTSTRIEIVKNLTINGGSANTKVTISGANNLKIFYILGDCFFNINNLVLTNGNGFGTIGGGAVNFNGTGNFTAINCNFIKNVARSGGAIYFNGTGTFMAINCNFIENTAIECSGAVYMEKGIFISTNCNFHKNISGKLSGAIHTSEIYIAINCSFIENFSPDNYVGTIHNALDNILNPPQTYLYHCTFYNNLVLETGPRAGSYYSYNCIYTQEKPLVTTGKNLIEEVTIHKNILATHNLIFGESILTSDNYIFPHHYATGADKLSLTNIIAPNITANGVTYNMAKIIELLRTDQAGNPRPLPENKNNVTYGSVEVSELSKTESGMTIFTIRASSHKQIDPTSRNYKIPIYIKADEDITKSSLGIKQLVITINKNVFYPKIVSNGDVSYFYDNDTINIKVENISVPTMKSGSEKVLLELIGDVLLGNTDSSGINLKEPIITFTDAVPELIDGCLVTKIYDNRFLMSYDKSHGIFVIENPASDFLRVKCICYERGSYYIEITDLLGTPYPLAMEGWYVNPDIETDFFFDIEIPNFIPSSTYLLKMYGPTTDYYTIVIINK